MVAVGVATDSVVDVVEVDVVDVDAGASLDVAVAADELAVLAPSFAQDARNAATGAAPAPSIDQRMTSRRLMAFRTT